MTEIPGLGYKIANRAVFLVKDGEVIYEKRLDDPSKLPDKEKLKEKIRTEEA